MERHSGVRVRCWAAALAAVCVVATGCSGTSEAGKGIPATEGDPPSATPTESSGADAEAVITARNAHVSSWAVDDAGAMLGVWVRGWGSRPPESLAVRTHAGNESLSAPPAGVATNVVANLPSGWLVNTSRHDKYKIARVDHDASVHRLIVSGANVTPRTGDVAAVFENRVLLYRPADDTLHVAPQPGMRWRTSAYVTSHGALLVFGRSGEAALWARFDKGRWSQGRWAAGTSVGVADASGDHIAVALGGPIVDGVDATPVAGLASSDDGGRSWREVKVPLHVDRGLAPL